MESISLYIIPQLLIASGLGTHTHTHECTCRHLHTDICTQTTAICNGIFLPFCDHEISWYEYQWLLMIICHLHRTSIFSVYINMAFLYACMDSPYIYTCMSYPYTYGLAHTYMGHSIQISHEILFCSYVYECPYQYL